MGYDSTFIGSIDIEPPLNQQERDYLTKFAGTRRMHRTGGPYFVDGEGEFGQGRGPDDIMNYNRPPEGQPGLWCQWVPVGLDWIEWDEGEKFYNAAEWMLYLIDHFLKPGAHASTSGDSQFDGFTFDHVLNGTIQVQGEDPEDRWDLVVRNNVVSVVEYKMEVSKTWPVLSNQ